MLVDASIEAQLHISTLDTSFVTGFSEVADLAKWLGDDQKEEQLIAHAALFAALVVVGVTSTLVPAIGAATAATVLSIQAAHVGPVLGVAGAAINGAWAGSTGVYLVSGPAFPGFLTTSDFLRISQGTK